MAGSGKPGKGKDSGEHAGTGAALVLAVDIGNTVTHIGLFDGDGMAASWSAATPPACTADEAGLVLAGFFGAAVRRGHLPALPAPAGAIVSSVVPALTDAWVGAAREACGGARPLVVGPGLKTGLKMAYHDPAEVGSDRIADIVAAKDSYGAPLVIVDLGTTTNIAVVDKEGAFAGGIIAPGMRMGGLALAQSAAKLAMTEVRAPASAIGKSTREAMQAGIVLGEAARIDGLVDMVCDELGYQAPVVMTGADAALVAPLLRHASHIDGGLTLRGLNLLYALNRRK